MFRIRNIYFRSFNLWCITSVLLVHWTVYWAECPPPSRYCIRPLSACWLHSPPCPNWGGALCSVATRSTSEHPHRNWRLWTWICHDRAEGLKKRKYWLLVGGGDLRCLAPRGGGGSSGVWRRGGGGVAGGCPAGMGGRVGFKILMPRQNRNGK